MAVVLAANNHSARIGDVRISPLTDKLIHMTIIATGITVRSSGNIGFVP